MMTSKRELVTKIDKEYLKDVILKVNNSPKYGFLRYNPEEFTTYVLRKFSKDDLKAIYRNYVFQKSPRQVALEIKERSGEQLISVLLKNLNGKFIGRREVKVGRRFCDLALFDVEKKSLYAIEAKANGDKIDGALNQCNDYAKWADYVYLLVEDRKMLDMMIFPRNIGIFIIEDNKVCKLRKAKENEVELENYLNLLTLSKLKNIARKYKLNLALKKDELKKELFELKSENLLTDCKITLIS